MVADTTPDLDFSPERVMRIRVALGESQKVFADRIGVTTNSVCRYETGQAKPTQARVLKALLEAEAETG